MSDGGGLRWLPPLRLSGCWQMAIDEWLLEQAVRAGQRHPHADAPVPAAALRFYSWSRPTLSLGFHQHRLEPRWQELQASGELDLVRRPSGGRAVLHGGSLTYALIWPSAPAGRREAYRQACQWLRHGFASLGIALAFGAEAATVEHPSCFASSTAADLVEPRGGKRIGSAQLWRRGVLLQHGSILLAPDPILWRQVLDQDPPPLQPLGCSEPQLIEQLRLAARQHLPMATGGEITAPLSGAEWSAIAARRQRYRLAAGHCTSPEESIERATGASARPRG